MMMMMMIVIIIIVMIIIIITTTYLAIIQSCEMLKLKSNAVQPELQGIFSHTISLQPGCDEQGGYKFWGTRSQDYTQTI